MSGAAHGGVAFAPTGVNRNRVLGRGRQGACLLAACLILPALVASAPAAWAVDPNPASIHSEGGAWPLYRQWTSAETRHFARWIHHLYERKCHGTREQQLAKLEAVLTDPDMNLLLSAEFAGEPSNPQIPARTMRAMHGVLDCGKLTVALSSYYAYRRGLPWMITRVRSGDGTDIRTSGGNIPCGSVSVLHYRSAHRFLVDAVQCFCTGNYRVAPGMQARFLSDTVPIAIDRRFVIPGCLCYVDGHVLLLAAIDEYGAPSFLDATVSPTRDIYTHNGLNAITGITPSSPGGEEPYAGCFQGIRTHRFPIAETDDDGRVVRIRRRTDAEMAAFGYSVEQYDRMRELVDTGRIVEGELVLDAFHDFVRLRLRSAGHIDPEAVLEAFADQFVTALEEREQFVQAAWAEVTANGPIAFPEGDRNANVYSAGGRWGRWSSCLSDAALREEYFQVLGLLDYAVRWVEIMPEHVPLWPPRTGYTWTSNDLALVLRHEKERIFSERGVHYTTSRRERVFLSLNEVEGRLCAFSFDPNHPPELRWGAAPGSPEAANAPEVLTPVAGGEPLAMAEAYHREAYYRTATYRDVEESCLRGMFMEGFPTRPLFSEWMDVYARHARPFPLIPSVGRNPFLNNELCGTVQAGTGP